MLRVNEQAEDFYDRSQELGILAADAFFSIQKHERDRHKAQMKGLENIAETAWKATDILDYIKKQVARERSGWTTTHQFGDKLKDYIENGLTLAIDAVCDGVGIGTTTEEDRRGRQRVRLELIRQLIRQVVVQYEYRVKEKETENKNSQ